MNIYSVVRRLVAAASLLAMAAVFFVPAAARWCGWLPRLQLVPALLAGAVLELIVLAVSVLLFGRLYCSVVCPLGILQDLFRFLFGWIVLRTHVIFRRTHTPVRSGTDKSVRSPVWIRFVVLALFVIGAFFGLTGLIEPYGIFGRFVTVGIRRIGEPAVVTVVWAIGLMAFVLAMTFVRARWWCNRICPVGTFLGLFSRFALFRVRINSSKCVTCGLCAKRCDKGALAVREDKTIAIDLSSCVACGNCLRACAKGALTLSGRNGSAEERT